MIERDPHVHRTLGELWLISDVVTADVNADYAAAKAKAARWEPAPMPRSWHPSQRGKPDGFDDVRRVRILQRQGPQREGPAAHD